MKDKATEGLRSHEVIALQFLANGPHCIGEIDSDEKLAIAVVFADLQKRGFVISDPSNNGPVFYISPAGLVALASPHENHRKPEP